MLTTQFADRRLELDRQLMRARLWPLGAVGQPSQPMVGIAGQPAVDRLARHPSLPSDLAHRGAGLHGQDHAIALLDNRQLHQDQSRPPAPRRPQPTRDRQADLGHLSTMWWNRYVKHLPGQDNRLHADARKKFLYILKAGPAGGRLRRPSSRRQRRGDHRDAGLTLPLRGAEVVGRMPGLAGLDRRSFEISSHSVLTVRIFGLCECFRTASISTRLPFTDHRRPVPNAVVSRPVYHGHARRTRGGG